MKWLWSIKHQQFPSHLILFSLLFGTLTVSLATALAVTSMPCWNNLFWCWMIRWHMTWSTLSITPLFSMISALPSIFVIFLTLMYVYFLFVFSQMSSSFSSCSSLASFALSLALLSFLSFFCFLFSKLFLMLLQTASGGDL